QDVLAAKDVSFADPAALEGEQMALGDIVDVSEVQAGVDEGRDPAARRVEEDAAGGGRLDVARADRRGRVADHGGQLVLQDHGLDRSLGQRFAALVHANG